MTIYIKGMGNISPQRTWGDDDLLSSPLSYTGTKLNCVEPDYASFIDAKQIRRMSRVIRMGIASAAMAMKEAGVPMPDGIITATGYGCLEDTGVFLSKMVGNKEEALNPTPFIQSTHNTIGSQIALLLQCQAYNQTYTHNAFSFENAVLDAMLQLSEEPRRSLLVGGIDEITGQSHEIQSRFGIFRKQSNDSLQLFSERSGTLNGEGSAFFVLSGIQGESEIASINALTTLYKPLYAELTEGVRSLLSQAGVTLTEVDFILSGKSGDSISDSHINRLCGDLFTTTPVGAFKHLCGEYPVASAFACWLAARMLKIQRVPEIVTSQYEGQQINNILLINQYFGTHYSLILLKAC